MSRCNYRKHRWVCLGPAGEFAGEPCLAWKCEVCGYDRELFADVLPRWGVIVSPPTESDDNG